MDLNYVTGNYEWFAQDMYGHPHRKIGLILTLILTPITEQSKRKFFSVGESQLCHAELASRHSTYSPP